MDQSGIFKDLLLLFTFMGENSRKSSGEIAIMILNVMPIGRSSGAGWIADLV